MLSTKSKFLLNKGIAIWNYPNGSRWVVKYKDKYYQITDDGTGNGFYSKGEPHQLSENEAKEILSIDEKSWNEAVSKFGWEPIEEYFEKTIK